ncbi:uncharacterized protein LOC123037690 [Drosophila rhopaloa]|uniref:Peptidase aspartic putative domain-containing protein n=1 Tax=Drosophila rhopaloa TaxID=1041015 RepID=A0ABM5J914_DRORH|nr:uncharacterized protein LOC123037690 [Drosophila rhopaloa]
MAPTTIQHARPRATNGYRCRVCRGVHALRKCQRFLRLPAVKRLRAVLINQYCANCLAHEHSGQSCRSNAKCHVCSGNHHTLLHFQESTSPRSSRPQDRRQQTRASSTTSLRSSSPKETSPTRSPVTGPSCAAILQRTSVSILPTASILVGSEEKRFDVRALVDPCCPVSRIHVSLTKALNLSVTRVGDERVCTTEIRSKSSKMTRQLIMLVDDQMQTRTPAKPLDPKVRDAFPNITLSDDRWFHPSLVSAVLGADVYAELILPGILPSQNGLPMAQNSALGWLLSGTCSLS